MLRRSVLRPMVSEIELNLHFNCSIFVAIKLLGTAKAPGERESIDCFYEKHIAAFNYYVQKVRSNPPEESFSLKRNWMLLHFSIWMPALIVSFILWTFNEGLCSFRIYMAFLLWRRCRCHMYSTKSCYVIIDRIILVSI